MLSHEALRLQFELKRACMHPCQRQGNKEREKLWGRARLRVASEPGNDDKKVVKQTSIDSTHLLEKKKMVTHRRPKNEIARKF